MSLVIKFYFTSSMLNMFRTLMHPSSGACDFSIVSPHWSCVLVSMCVGVSMWLGWGGIRVAVVLQPVTRIPSFRMGVTIQPVFGVLTNERADACATFELDGGDSTELGGTC